VVCLNIVACLHLAASSKYVAVNLWWCFFVAPNSPLLNFLNIVHFHFNVIPRALPITEQAGGNRQLQYSIWSGSGSQH